MSFTFQCTLPDGKRFTLQPMQKDHTIEALQMSIQQESDIPPQFQLITLNNKILNVKELNTIGDLNLSQNNKSANGPITLQIEWNLQTNDITMENTQNTQNTDNNNNNNNTTDDTGVGDDMSLDSNHSPNIEEKYQNTDQSNTNDTNTDTNTNQNHNENQKQITPQPMENPDNATNTTNPASNPTDTAKNDTNTQNTNNNGSNTDKMETDDTMDAATQALINQLMTEDTNAMDSKMNENNSNNNNNNGNDNDIDLEMPSFPDFEFDENKVDGTSLPKSDVTELFDLLWGKFANVEDIKRWFSQGIDYVDIYEDRLKFGLLQIYGGPCGVLAPVQGYILKEFLFDPKLGVKLSDESECPILATNEQRNEALVRACHSIMCKCAIDQTFFRWIVAMKPDLTSLYETKIYYKEYNTVESLKTAISDSLTLLHSNLGIVSFIFSVLLSRTSHVIKDEMDDSSQPLVLEQFGHCSQEIVNLVLTGRAVTNVHDGDKVLSSNNQEKQASAGADDSAFVLKGILPDQDIGFLSSLEAMRHAKVGDYYKTPKYPIWVVGSSSHYSILFSLNINVGKISSAAKEEQEILRSFHIIDQHEQGLVPLENLGDLLGLCGLDRLNANDVKSIVDPENTGVILRLTFVKNYKYLKAANRLELKWECKKCTFHNEFKDGRCAVCNEFRGMASQLRFVIESNNQNGNNDNSGNNGNNKDSGNGGGSGLGGVGMLQKQKSVDIPKNFALYHYNGLKTTKKDKPTLTKLMVFDDQELDGIGAIAEELTALIRTKWEYAIVEFDGPFKPKIA